MVEKIEINRDLNEIKVHYFQSYPWSKDFTEAPTLEKNFLIRNSLFFKSTEIVQKENRD